jgi:hypothetical protein
LRDGRARPGQRRGGGSRGLRSRRGSLCEAAAAHNAEREEHCDRGDGTDAIHEPLTLR